MKKKILIDTDVVINFLKGVNKAVKYIKSHSGEDGIFQKPIKSSRVMSFPSRPIT